MRVTVERLCRKFCVRHERALRTIGNCIDQDWIETGINIFAKIKPYAYYLRQDIVKPHASRPPN